MKENFHASFSNPVDTSSSKAEPFKEDEMYGSDHDMFSVCKSLDDSNDA